METIGALVIVLAGFFFGLKGFLCAAAIVIVFVIVSELDDSPEERQQLREHILRTGEEDRRFMQAARQREAQRSLYDDVTAQDPTGKLRRDVDHLLPDADEDTKANAAYDLMNDGTKFGDK